MPRVVITGGKGDLAQAFQQSFTEAEWEVLSPGKDTLDVANSESVRAYFQAVGEIDLLICNAGTTNDAVFAKQNEDSWDTVIDINLKGAFRCAQAASKQMLQHQKGHIIFISSYSALHPPIGQSNYASAKAGLIGMAQSLAQEWGAQNIRVNVIIPGFLETKMTKHLDSRILEKARDKHVLGRFNTTKNVADFARFIEESMPHTSGQVWNLDSRLTTFS